MKYTYTFGNILEKVKKHISLASQFDTAQETQIKEVINNVHLDICNQIPFPSLRKRYSFTAVPWVITGTATVVNGSATVVIAGDTPDITWIDKAIRISNDAPYYYITAVSGQNVTIDALYTSTSGSGLNYKVFQLGYDMPRDFVGGRDTDFRDMNLAYSLEYVPWEEISHYDPGLFEYGPPISYTRIPDFAHRDPIGTTTNTMDAGTNTTTVVDAALTYSDNDHYTNWVLVNTTRNLTSQVTGYVGASHTLTISPAITAQTTGDSYYLIDVRVQLMPYPIPSDLRNFTVEYMVEPTEYVNAYDVPNIPHDLNGEDLLIHGTLMRYYVTGDKYAQSKAIYDSYLTKLKGQYSRLYNAPFRKQGYASRMFQRSLSLRIPYRVSNV